MLWNRRLRFETGKAEGEEEVVVVVIMFGLSHEHGTAAGPDMSNSRNRVAEPPCVPPARKEDATIYALSPLRHLPTDPKSASFCRVR